MGALILGKPSQFFWELVEKAWQKQKLEDDYTVALYLAKLLDNFLNVSRVEKYHTHDLSTIYLENIDTSKKEKLQRVWWVGDTSLFIAGIFPNNPSVAKIGPSGYRDLCSMAYGKVLEYFSKTEKYDELRHLFQRLSQETDLFIKTLMMVAKDGLRMGNLENLIKCYLHTKSNEDLRLLQLYGVDLLPYPAKDAKFYIQ